ncbi:alpha/beta hydrolase [Flindersiella endophytica]
MFTALAKPIVSSALLVAATMTPALAAAQPVRAESLSWAPCPGVSEPAYGLECTTLDVPLDYKHRNGQTIELAVSRLRSTDPAKRRGVLLVNPGGQGASMLDLPVTLVNLGLPTVVRERYDIVMFDPRGIGRSTPVRCDLSPDQAATLIPPSYARDAADVERRAAYSRQVAGQCTHSSTARLLPYITMSNVARDMDEIRTALGETRISYLGYSNGTQLGAFYHELFPAHTDRFVLDSLSQYGLNSTTSRQFARGVEDRFPDFATWAAGKNATYGLGATPSAVRAKYFELVERLDATPYSGVDGAAFRALTFGLLFNDATFEPLAQTWQAIDQGGQLPPIPAGPGGDFSGMLHLVCNKPGWSHSIATYQRNVAHDRVRYPMFGAAGANVWPCAYWPAPTEEHIRIDADGPANLLLVNNLRDPGTPYAGALEFRHAQGRSARMVTVDAGGHQVYLFNHNTCANQIITTYLAGGERPATDRLCPTTSDDTGLR